MLLLDVCGYVLHSSQFLDAHDSLKFTIQRPIYISEKKKERKIVRAEIRTADLPGCDVDL